MQIILQVDSKEKLLDALNNAIVAYGDIVNTFFFSCDTPFRWKEWQRKNNKTDEECYSVLSDRHKLLESVYEQIERISDADSD